MAAHDVLGLPAMAEPHEVQAAYRRLAKRHHPDRGGDAEKFRRINEAREVLLSRPEPTRPLATPWEVAANIAISLLLALAGALCFVSGDRVGAYNGAIVILGWLLLLVGWRAFADRRFKFRNPLFSLFDAALILGLGAVGLAWRIGAFLALLLAGVGIMAVAEKIIG